MDNIQEKFGLGNYFLKRHHVFLETNGMGKTSYILNMEWYPNDLSQADEDYNPPGVASIDADIHTGYVKRIIFVQDTTYADQAVYPGAEKENSIEWVEELTGLEFGRQFRLVHDEGKKLGFQAAVDNIPVYPAGMIQVQFNEENQFTLFSIDGYFPDEDQISWEPFSLLPETTDSIAKEQCKLLEIPAEDQKKWLSVYGATTVFVSNDGKRTIPFETVESHPSTVRLNKVMEWNEPIDKPFSPVEIDMSIEVSEEQALSNKPGTELTPPTDVELKELELEIINFLRREFPEESGKWELREIRPENNYTFAALKPVHQDNRIIDRKITLILDKETGKSLNFIDNSMLLDMFSDFEKAESPAISQDDAFEKLRRHIEVTPVYVYNRDQGKYKLCGKIDCEYGVDAVTGDVISLDEL